MASLVPTSASSVVTAAPLSLGAALMSVIRPLHTVLMDICGSASTPTDGSTTTTTTAVRGSSGGALAAALTCVAVVILMLLRLKRSRGGFRRDDDEPPTKGSDGSLTGDDNEEELEKGVSDTSTGGIAGYLSYLLGRLVGDGDEDPSSSTSTTHRHQTHSHKKQRKLNRKTKLLEDINLKNNRFYLKSNHHGGGGGHGSSINTEYKGKGGGSGRPPRDHSSATSSPTPIVTAASLAAHAFEEFKKSHLDAQGKTIDPALPTLIFTMGIPGCGKSTWAKQYIEKVDPTCTVVSSDEIRKELLGDVNDQSVNKLIYEIVLSQCQALLRQGRNVIVDGTNVHTSIRRNFLRRLIKGDAPDISLATNGGGSSAPNSASRRSMGGAGGVATNNGRYNSPNGSMGSTSSMGSTTPATPPPLSQFGVPNHHHHTSIGLGSDSLGAVQVCSASDSFRPSPLRDEPSPDAGGFPAVTTSGSPRSNSRAAAAAQPPSRGMSQGEIAARAEAMVMAVMGTTGANPPLVPIVANNPPRSAASSGTSPLLPTAPDALVPPPIRCNRLLKVFNVTKAVAKGRISRDIQKKVNRSDVPPQVVDRMSVQLQESVSAIKDENWIPLV